MYRPPDWQKKKSQVAKSLWYFTATSFEAGADAMLEALKARGKYYRLHRTFKPPGYKQPLRVPGHVVFIPDKTEE